jgi:hypothetical protein
MKRDGDPEPLRVQGKRGDAEFVVPSFNEGERGGRRH